MAVNQQYVDRDPFGGSGGYASTGAAGSAVAGPETSAGPVVGRVVVTASYGSSQVDQPVAVVMAGDTCAMSTDSPVPAGGDWTGVPQSFIQSTGERAAASLHSVNPNASGVSDMAAQAAAARRSS
jgi:hypothetical protein